MAQVYFSIYSAFDAYVAEFRQDEFCRRGTEFFNQAIPALENLSDLFLKFNNRCISADDMVQSELDGGASPSGHLDNCTVFSQDAIATKGDSSMAKYRMRVCVGYTDDDKPILKQVSGNKETELADKIVRAILASDRRSEFVTEPPIQKDTDSPLFRDYADAWLNDFKVSKCKPTTLSGYASSLRKHLYPAFGNMPVSEFDVPSIQKFLDSKKNYAAKTIREVLNLLRQILECAMRDGYLRDNPAKDPRISIPSTKKSERKALDMEEVREIVSMLPQLDTDAQRYLAIAIFTGMRRGEILGLRWEDIDQEKRVIKVRRNVTHVNNQPLIGTTKTSSGVRDVAITENLLKFLLPFQQSGFILCVPNHPEEPYSLTRFRTMMRHIEKSIDLHGATSHTFRHTLATLLGNSGADVKTIQGILGQKDFKTTAERYMHPVDTSMKKAVQKVTDSLI